MSVLLEMKDISKSFSDTKVLNGVQLSVEAGEVHALLGENGAGKSTLMKILGGIYSKDSGEIFINGKKADIHNVVSARDLGISIIHQELMMAQHLTIAENVFMGREIMKNGMVPPADMGKFAEKIYNEAQRLIALVQDIIKLSKLDEKDTSLCEEEVELDALVQEACERLQPAAERKRISLLAETEPILFRGVKQVLSEMIYNLCDNAIRYNKEGGAVFVTLKQKADRISLTVRDTGIGIAKEEQGRIFERFYRVDASRSAENGGTGLGLSIVKHGAALHNGKIFIESEIGNGTNIEISLPYSIN